MEGSRTPMTVPEAIAHGSAAEPNGLADDARVFPKSGRPKTVRENDDAGSFGPSS